MLQQEPERRKEADSFDQIAKDLRQLRLDAGEVSYAEIVRRIAKHREANGTAPAAARPARTTIYDAFRSGRSRINAQLVREIARALGADEKECALWERRCIVARQCSEPIRTAEQIASSSDDQSQTVPSSPRAEWWERHAAFAHILLAVACLGINFAGYCAVEFFYLSLYMDSIGTGLAAIVLGPWWGVAVGVGTNLLGYTIHGPMALPFALQSAAFALVWGYGARRFRMTRTLRSYFRLNVYVGLSHLLIAIPILLLMFGGGTGHAGDAISQKLVAMGAPLSIAVYGAQTGLAVADSLLAGFIVIMLVGFIRTKPPFQSDCAHLFPFYDQPNDPHTYGRLVTAPGQYRKRLRTNSLKVAASRSLAAIERHLAQPACLS
jgi:energy-coupling factor transport system substrate-specific component